MSELLPKPIPTLITEDVFDSLARVNAVGGQAGRTLKVERLNAKNHELNNPEHLKAIVDPGDPEKAPDTGSGFDTFVRTYAIRVWLLPSQTDGMPIDELADAVVADVALALCEDDGLTNPRVYTRGGWAEDTWFERGETVGPLPGSLAWLITVLVSVRYTTRMRDAYRRD